MEQEQPNPPPRKEFIGDNPSERTASSLPTIHGMSSVESPSPPQRPGSLRLRLILLGGLASIGAALALGTVFANAGAALQSPLVLGLLLLLFATAVAGMVVATRLSQTPKGQKILYKVPINAKRRFERGLVLVSVILAAVLALPVVAFFLGVPTGLPGTAWIHFACASLLAAMAPYGFYRAREERRIHRMEARFPDFLRDIASSHKGGLTLAESVRVAARGEYGPLTPEVRRMADQITWNLAFTEALQMFADRVDTPLVRRAVALILQADKSGGATTDVLLAAARDAREIKTLQNERRLSMSLYAAVIYVTFFVFLGVAAVLYSQFIPQLVASQNAAAAQAAATGVGGPGGVSGVGGATLRIEDFQLFYFMAAIMQGIGDGIVAGMMGQGRAVLGLRHSCIMVFIAYVTFVFLL
ncbi:MAG: archaeal flagellar protein FlaJ [Thermoplasmata archaeon]|jgi:flagellar protein FlaJ|nr:archaeal flagellar protein FlaJ [Thermoplasmata archaeon]